MKTYLIGFCFLFACFSAYAQVSLIKDINTQPKSSFDHTFDNYPYVGCDGLQYIVISDDFYEASLWVSDGSAEGTKKLTDIQGDPIIYFDDKYQNFGCYQDKVYFGVNQLDTITFWTTDGSVENTKPSFKVPNNTNLHTRSGPYGFTTAHGLMYFMTETEDQIILWQSDGTQSGTRKIGEIAIASGSFFNVDYIYATNTHLCLAVRNVRQSVPGNTSGLQVWAYGFEEASFNQIGISYSDIISMQPVGNHLMFIDREESSTTVWKTDGTNQNTIKIYDGNIDKQVYVYGEKLVFSQNGKIYSTDFNFEYVQTISDGFLVAGTVVNNKFYGIADYDPYGCSAVTLLEIEGQTPKQLAVINELACGFYYKSKNIATINDRYLLMPYKDSTESIGAGAYDIAEGAFTTLVPNDTPTTAPVMWATVGDKVLYFDNSPDGQELWVTNGTPEGTHYLMDTNPGTLDAFYNFQDLEVINEVAYFDIGSQIWQSDGTEAGTASIYQFEGYQTYLGTAAGKRYYLVDNSQLMYYDTQTDANYTFKTFPEAVEVSAQELRWDVFDQSLGDKLIFKLSTLGPDYNYGGEFWATDGTTAGTYLLKDINPGPASSLSQFRHKMQRVGNHIVFEASDKEYSDDLWATDGTSEGTRMLVDAHIIWHTWNDKVLSYTTINGKNAFSVVSTTTDSIFSMIFPDNTTVRYPSNIAVGEKGVYFHAKNEVWLFNETSEYTQKIDIPGYQNAKMVISSGGKLMMITESGQNFPTYSLSSYDEASGIVRDAKPYTSYGPYLPYISNINGIAYFENDGEIWRTDGSSPGTELVAHGNLWSTMRKLGDHLIFIGDTPEYGKELYKIPITKLPQAIEFNNIADVPFGSKTKHLGISATSGLPVAITHSGAIAGISDGVATFKNPGKAEVSASQSGNAQYLPAPSASTTFCINPTTPTISLKAGTNYVLTSSISTDNRWYFNGTLINNTTGQEIEVDKTGTYTVQTEVEGCQSLLSDPFDVVVTGVEDVQAGTIKVWPNPVVTNLKIANLSPINGPVTLTVKNTTGQIVAVHQLQPEGPEVYDLPMDSHPKGIYIMSIQQNDTIKNVKFMKL